MKKLIFLLLCAFSFSVANAENIPVGLYAFDYMRGVKELYPMTISSHISEKLSCFQNIDVIDEMTFQMRERAQDDLKSEDYIHSETVEQGRTIGAEKLVSGIIMSADERYDSRNNYHTVNVLMKLSIIDIESGRTESKLINFKGVNQSKAQTGASKFLKDKLNKRLSKLDQEATGAFNNASSIRDNSWHKAMESALKDMDRNMMAFFYEHFGQYNCNQKNAQQAVAANQNTDVSMASAPPAELFIFSDESDSELIIEIVGVPRNWKSGETHFDIYLKTEKTNLRTKQKEPYNKKIASATFVEFTSPDKKKALIKVSQDSDKKVADIVDLMMEDEEVSIVKKQ